MDHGQRTIRLRRLQPGLDLRRIDAAAYGYRRHQEQANWRCEGTGFFVRPDRTRSPPTLPRKPDPAPLRGGTQKAPKRRMHQIRETRGHQTRLPITDEWCDKSTMERHIPCRLLLPTERS